MSFVRLMLCTAICLTLAACGSFQPSQPLFVVQVDAIASPQAATNKTYLLVSENDAVDPRSLQFQEFASYVQRALLAQGFVPAKTAKEAGVSIGLAYGISEPLQETTSYEIPLRGDTGVLESSETKTSVSKTGEIVSTTTYRTAQAIIGYRTATKTTTTFASFVELIGYDLKAPSVNPKANELWRIHMANTGVTDDIRQLFPILLAAGAPYIGNSTGKKMDVVLTEDDLAVLTVKGMPLPRQDKQNPREADKPHK
ncbi:hypothetical protein [Lampropedia aestuarii]|uniref:hypothetical protein n=1 Tax=Lampropedia aestuarii TaxID=2562762 RepID=UPI00246867FC|nr:hypothetical protein [Lampropedia aestuarii]MDH5859139.1 hypothetical protein [Lampropedia aestuarii]